MQEVFRRIFVVIMLGVAGCVVFGSLAGAAYNVVHVYAAIFEPSIARGNVFEHAFGAIASLIIPNAALYYVVKGYFKKPQ